MSRNVGEVERGAYANNKDPQQTGQNKMLYKKLLPSFAEGRYGDRGGFVIKGQRTLGGRFLEGLRVFAQGRQVIGTIKEYTVSTSPLDCP